MAFRPHCSSLHRDYIARGQLKTVYDSLSSQPVIDYAYLADGAANPMENGYGDRFRYDEEGQLVEAWYNAADPSASGDGATRYDNFSYDALGNRFGWDYVASRHQWMNFTRKDNGLNQYRAWWPYSIVNYDDDIGGSWGNPGAANGVIMQDGNITAGYNALNQPMLATSNALAPNWMFFGYDPLGRCVKRWTGPLVNGWVPPADSNPATYYYYDGWSLIQEGPGAGTPDRIYVHGAQLDQILASFQYPTGMALDYYYDAMGNSTLMIDDYTGNIWEQYEYDAFGQPYFFDSTAQPLNSSTFGNRFLFTGREYLIDLKLYDYRNRLYQPELGRFLQPDPKEFGAGDYNLYRYCHNDPVNRSDPFGLLEADHEDKELAKPTLVKDTYRPVTGSHIPIHIRVFNSGNWNDRSVANHATTGLEAQTGKGGLTKPSGSSDVSGSNVDINMHVDWYYDAKYSGTNVVTRELQHVQDARSLERGFGMGVKAPASLISAISRVSSAALTPCRYLSMIKQQGLITCSSTLRYQRQFLNMTRPANIEFSFSSR